MNYSTLAKQQKSIAVPAAFFKHFYEAVRHFDSLNEELEDWFLSFDKKTVSKLKKARKEHLAGKVKPLAALL